MCLPSAISGELSLLICQVGRSPWTSQGESKHSSALASLACWKGLGGRGGEETVLSSLRKEGNLRAPGKAVCGFCKHKAKFPWPPALVSLLAYSGRPSALRSPGALSGFPFHHTPLICSLTPALLALRVLWTCEDLPYLMTSCTCFFSLRNTSPTGLCIVFTIKSSSLPRALQ